MLGAATGSPRPSFPIKFSSADQLELTGAPAAAVGWPSALAMRFYWVRAINDMQLSAISR